MKKKRAVVSIIVLTILAVATGVWWLIPTKMITNNAEQISYIKVGNGSTGKQFTITDKDDINSIIQMLQTTTIKKTEFNGARSGFIYTIGLYSNDGTLYKKLTLISESSIVIGSFLYHVQGDAIDLTLLKQLEENLTE